MTGTGSREGTSALPVDVATMRASVAQVLPPDVTPSDAATLDTLTGLLRGHMELIIPEVEQAAVRAPADGVPRYCALASLGEARRKLGAVRGTGAYDAVVYARKLARSLLALCDHYETLTGVRMCLACGQPLKDGEETLPYDKVSPSGGAAGAGRIHVACAGQ
ncbi:DUF6415 family natural product biosynthesis protein [Streptomyces sp. NPDC050803]|uniref:DUF6415 family natural product biosynthesis protein n=1 Tax=unclassified Streptomyces TaxID=2593676 RepID=UPI0034456076